MRRVLLLLLIPLSFTNLTAQDTLTAGDKVRVTTEEERVVGFWVSADGKQLVFNAEQSGVQLALPLSSVVAVEVSRESDYALDGAIFGFLAGVVGGGFAAKTLTEDDSTYDAIGKGLSIWLGFTVGGLG